MKTIKISIYLFISIIICNDSDSQQFSPNNVSCMQNVSAAMCYDNSFLGGQCKPESIERYTTDANAVFRVLVVYVQLQDDPFPDAAHWMRGQPPAYFGDMLAEEKQTTTDWWNTYNESTARMSDYWMEVSRGKFHVIGQEVNVILPHNNDWYISNGGAARAMDDLYDILSEDPTINWPLYDQWSKSGSNFVYGTGDGYIDMVYFIFRSQTNIIGIPDARMSGCSHGGEHIIYNSGGVQKKLNTSYSEFGSGFQIAGSHGTPLDLWAAVSFIGHEHGHYLLGVRTMGWHDGHQGYGKINNYFGMEEFYSPYELIRPGYFQTKKVDYSDKTTYPLGDWSSRNTQPYTDPDEILEVPIGDENRNEFFLVVNRQRVSTYDRIMWGDTAHGNPYHDINPEYGKGIYIYHAYPGVAGSGYQWQIPFDQECADGLWNWNYEGDIHPDWSTTQWVPYFKKTIPIFQTNDASSFNIFGQNTGLQNKDGKSVNLHWFEESYWKIYTSWFGIGKEKQANDYAGTDRVFTNNEGVWTSREHQGDRWDAWKVDYNEVFSPYSSPSTVDWDDEYTGIFIYLESMNGITANMKIYKAGEGGYTEDDILAATPPSKPMLYRPVTVYNCNGTSGNPRITWDNNLEPDMNRSSMSGPFKRYKIYRAISTNDNVAPLPYTYHDTYDDYTPDDTANFIDNSVLNGAVIYCGLTGTGNNDTYFRYKIQADDKYDSVSVLSDFVSIKGHSIIPDSPVFDTEEPLTFSLAQNYPNPFNPATQIKFTLPQNTFVTIKVFNALGQEVAVLLNNEFKDAGSYGAMFDGTNFASGIYFYSIEAGTFKDIKKMVLIK